jgi:hypothetical protein
MTAATPEVANVPLAVSQPSGIHAPSFIRCVGIINPVSIGDHGVHFTSLAPHEDIRVRTEAPVF